MIIQIILLLQAVTLILKFVIGALQKKLSSEISYKDIVKASSNDALMSSKQIEKDLLRTMPANACFNNFASTGVPRLRRILRGLAWLYPDIGFVLLFHNLKLLLCFHLSLDIHNQKNKLLQCKNYS